MATFESIDCTSEDLETLNDWSRAYFGIGANLVFELTDADGDVIDVFYTRKGALQEIEERFGEIFHVGPASRHFPDGIVEPIHVTPEAVLCYLHTCEGEE